MTAINQPSYPYQLPASNITHTADTRRIIAIGARLRELEEHIFHFYPCDWAHREKGQLISELKEINLDLLAQMAQ